MSDVLVYASADDKPAAKEAVGNEGKCVSRMTDLGGAGRSGAHVPAVAVAS